MVVFTALGSSASLTVKFHINPVKNYTVLWYMGISKLQVTNGTDIVTKQHVETTYAIKNVTSKQLGNYTCHVINSELTNEENGSIFKVTLKLRGKLEGSITFIIYILQTYVSKVLIPVFILFLVEQIGQLLI